MEKEIENKIMAYIFSVAICFIFFAKKPQDFGAFAGKMMAWWCFPILIVVFCIFGFFERNKLRWLKSKWAVVSFNQFIKFMIYGMVEKQLKK